ncbi:putative metal-binding motif-containing protein [Solirubrobacter sp. CPCC 204708]|uniref:MopE-related protein n=1 Tax=Solirubrobacter deserti TaxID=2282478 RepID=A0ABT4RHU0_9ACTN|nr:MopE-related protein [Solirubrobacter deserti]MBE2316588.1 putative metal-binding motif-containing protein [Solirubrobacter deserti]MDA0138120.1 MopE-related protein [Solirubrobacter deserti]
MLAVASALLLAAAPQPPVIRSPAEGQPLTRSSVTFTFDAPIGRPHGFECRFGKGGTIQDCSKGLFAVSGLSVGTYTFAVRTYQDDDVSAFVERDITITAIDDDADGSPLPADCNDGNPAIGPAATDVPDNGVDENCDGRDAVTPPVTPAAPSPTPTPTPVAQAPTPEIDVALSYFMRASKRHTRFSTLSLKDVPSGATITVRCTGGCPRKRVTISGRSGTVALTAFRHRALRVGAKLTIEVTKPGSIGMAKVLTIRPGKRPTIATRTLT